jgi:phosphate transport system protein
MPMHMQREIERLKKMILSLSAVVEESVRTSVRSIETRNCALAAEVIANDIRIDQTEVDVEEECLKILALHQPVAIDLRYIVAVLKMNNDLERIGDLAVNIAERTVFLCERAPISAPFDLNGMSHKTLGMLQGSLDAMMNMDPERARAVLASDDEVDDINRQMYSKICAAMRQNPEHAEVLLSYLSAARSLERIADSTTNIAEDVIYLVEGRIVRHGRGRPARGAERPTA